MKDTQSSHPFPFQSRQRTNSPTSPRPTQNSIRTDSDPAHTDSASPRRARSIRSSNGSSEYSPTRSDSFFQESPRPPRATAAPQMNPSAASRPPAPTNPPSSSSGPPYQCRSEERR